MVRDINFLRDRRKRLTKAQAQDKKMLQWSLIAFGVIVVVGVIATGIRVFMLSQQTNLVRDQEQLKATILSQESIERKYVLLAGKMKAIEEIFKLRQDKQEAINFFYDRLGNEIILQQIVYDPLKNSDPQLSITVQAPDVFTFEQVQQVITSQDVKTRYPGITASNINRESKGTYKIDLSVPLKAL